MRPRPPHAHHLTGLRMPFVAGALAFALIVAACTPTPSDDASSTGDVTASTSAAATGAGDGSTGIATPVIGTPDGVPPLSTLVPEQLIVAPGDTVTLAGPENLDGELVLTGPDGTQLTGVFGAGHGSVDLPAGAPEGEWRATVTGDTGAMAFGVVEVASGPTLLLVSDRSRVRDGDAVIVTLYSAGLPGDTGILFGWGNLDWDAYFDDEEADGEEPLGVLVPDDNGLLQVGTQPVALSDVVGVPLMMSGMEMAGLQAMAFSVTDTDVYLSNPLSLAACSAPVVVTGTIGGPGAVHLVSFSDGLASGAVVTGDGTFTLDVPHGPMTLFASRNDGSALDPVALDVPCGATVDVDVVAGAVSATGGVAGDGTGAADEELAAVDGGSLTLTGDLGATFDVEPVCQYRRDSLGIIFTTYDEDLPAVQLEIPGADTSGSHSGTVEVTDWSSTTRSSSGAAEVSLEYLPGQGIAEAEMTVTGEFAGPSGAGTIEASFGCIVTGVTPPPPGTTTTAAGSAPPAEESPTEALPTAFDTPGPDPASLLAGACRTIVVDDLVDPAVGVAVAAEMRSALGRATVVTLSEMRTVFDTDHPDGVLSQAASAIAASTPDIVVYIDGTGQMLAAALDVPGGAGRGEDWVVTGTPSEVIEALVGGVLCVDVDPIDVASGGSEDIIVQASDLTGAPIAEASVSIGATEFGTVAMSAAMLINGVYRATYIGSDSAGEDLITVELTGGEYWPTTVRASVATGFGYILEGQYRVELNPTDDDVPVPGGPLSATLVARSCTGRTGPWDGLLVLEAGPVLTMIALGGAAGAIGYGVFGPAADPGGLVGPPMPDPVTSIVSAAIGGGGDFADLAMAADDIVAGIEDPYSPFVMPATFTLSRSGTTTMAIDGEESGYTLRVRPGHRNVVQLAAEGTHLLNAVIERTSCPSNEDLRDRVRELVPVLGG